jgi:Carboxypeptidase regulatory-like domain
MRAIHILILVTALFSTTASLRAQTIRGTVHTEGSLQPIIGASISLRDGQKKSKKLTTQTDSLGKWSIHDVTPGVWEVYVEMLGFASRTVREVTIVAGKERVLDIVLTPGSTELPAFEVTESRPLYTPQSVGELPLTREQTLRYPATFYDPVRLATALPGVATADDGTNRISVRGNNPTFVRWRLEGADIVSPNHLPNANTLNDLPAAASGGVLMLSSQVIDNSALITGNATAEYGDAIGGIVDLRLRAGNNRQHERTIQAGLLGFEAMLEGPTGRKGASYLANYRYSFTGLLGELGVSFGGEEIGFSDVVVHFNVPTSYLGDFSLYWLEGRSSNVFTRPDTATNYKEQFDIDFRSNTRVVGLRHSVRLFTSSTIESNITLSSQVNEHLRARVLSVRNPDDIRNENEEIRYNMSSTWTEAIRPHITLKLGGALIVHHNSARQGIDIQSVINRTRIALRTWLTTRYQFDEGKGLLQVGVHPSTYFSLGANTLDPRFSMRYVFGTHSAVTVSAGLYTQARPIQNPINMNDNSGGMKSSQWALRYSYQTKQWAHRVELFRQSMAYIPVGNFEGSTYSVFNELEYTSSSDKPNTLSSRGHARTWGVEFASERFLAQGWFANANLSLLRSEYRTTTSVWLRSRWDIGHVANLTVGKEWTKKVRKSSKKHTTWGTNMRVLHMGGYRAMPVDEVQSDLQDRTVYLTTNGFSIKQKPYFRTDLRVYWKRSVADKYNHTVALDLQNVSSYTNIGWEYYDPFLDQVLTRNQLGLVPNLSWKLEF